MYEEGGHAMPTVQGAGRSFLTNPSQIIKTNFSSTNKTSNKKTKRKEQKSKLKKEDMDNTGKITGETKGNESSSAEEFNDESSEDKDDNLKECSLCLGEYGPDQWFVLQSDCKHEFSINCLQQYVRIEILEGRIELRCPQCPTPMHPNDIENLAVEGEDKSLILLYYLLMVQRVLVVNPDTRWCPAPDCSFGVIATNCGSCPKIDCQREGCKISFCYHCKEKWDDNHQCEKMITQEQQDVSETTNPNRAAVFIDKIITQVQQDVSETTNSSQAAVFIDKMITQVHQDVSETINPSKAVDITEDIERRKCPRCSVLVEKEEDGSCNHMKCTVCGCEFCWLCRKEITDLHYMSPSGCTFWGKKQWNKTSKIKAQLGTMIGAPLVIPLLAGISIPTIVIGFPIHVGRSIFKAGDKNKKFQRFTIVTGGVAASIIAAPIIAAVAVPIGVIGLFGYTYVAVPRSLIKTCKDRDGQPINDDLESIYKVEDGQQTDGVGDGQQTVGVGDGQQTDEVGDGQTIDGVVDGQETDEVGEGQLSVEFTHL